MTQNCFPKPRIYPQIAKKVSVTNAMGNGRKIFLSVLTVCVVILLTTGCGSNGRQAITGTVSLDGKPLETGSISFRSLMNTTENHSGGIIRDGVFEIPSQKGLFPGKYSVTIQAFKPTGRTINDPEMGSRPEVVPVRFKESSGLEADISDGDSNHLEFNLTSLKIDRGNR